MSTTIRLFSEDDEARMRVGLHAVGEGLRRALADLGASIRRGLAVQAEQARRDRDDELDWLGDWGGRRG